MPGPRDSQSNRVSSRSALALVLAALGACLIFAGFGPAVPTAAAAPAAMVDLGTASTYSALSGASVGNTVSADGDPHTTLRGDLGVKANAQPTGFPPGIVTGTINVGNPAAAQAHADLVAAYNEVAARTGGTTLPLALAGKTLQPGLYTVPGAASNTGTLTLDGGGDSNAVFVIQVNGALAFAAGSHVVLTNGAQASRVFWQVNGAGAVGAGGSFTGTLMALDAVAMGNGTRVNGRALARNGALSLDANEFFMPPPAIAISGGTTAITTDTTPTISGTTDVEAPAMVTVTVDGQTLTATPSDGAWSVTSGILANGAYPVVATVTDGAGNIGTSSQQLTVDTVLPVVTLDGGPSAATNDPTPTISGTSDVAPGTTVHVAVDSQMVTALVQPGGTWNVTPSALLDGSHTVTASVSDPAGNVGSDSQALSVDTTAPAVSITGGATALTNDPTPDISGTADVPSGTTVTLTLADETLSGSVQGDGTWTVTASALSDGPHRAIVEVSDAAGNSASFTQTLTVDTVSPSVAISGGASATTDDVDPTITGTSNAAPGTTVTVSIAAQTLTTLLQPNGTWNATPTSVGDGTWTVIASAPDPAGNVGSAQQTLVIGPDAPPPVVPPADPGSPPAVPAPTVPGNGSQPVSGHSISIGTTVTASAGSGVVATGSGTVKIQGVKKKITLATAVMTLQAGQSGQLNLKPKGNKAAVRAAFKQINAALADGRKVVAALTITMVDDAGTHVVKRTVELTKARAKP
jgi:hypothetical protein